MAIDYTALLGLTAGIQVAKADYDFTRDGGAVGVHAIQTGIVPAGSLVFGWVARAETTFTFATTGYMNIMLGDIAVGNPEHETGYVKAELRDGDSLVPTPADYGMVALVAADACTAGKGQFWLFYLPT